MRSRTARLRTNLV